MSEKKIILARSNEAKPSAKVEIFTPEDMKHVKKLIYLKRFTHSIRWHFALPETVTKQGILTFCGIRFWAKDQTQSKKTFNQRLEKESGLLCESCAFEYKLAEDELRKQDYI